MRILTKEEGEARARAVNIKTFGDPELYIEESKPWVREKAEEIRASVKDGETLEACYRRMFKDMRAEAEQKFPGCGWVWYSISFEIGLGDMWGDRGDD